MSVAYLEKLNTEQRRSSMAWPMAALGSAVRSASEGVRIDVGARMRGMWR
jgi:hypothetical protein